MIRWCVPKQLFLPVSGRNVTILPEVKFLFASFCWGTVFFKARQISVRYLALVSLQRGHLMDYGGRFPWFPLESLGLGMKSFLLSWKLMPSWQCQATQVEALTQLADRYLFLLGTSKASLEATFGDDVRFSEAHGCPDNVWNLLLRKEFSFITFEVYFLLCSESSSFCYAQEVSLKDSMFSETRCKHCLLHLGSRILCAWCTMQISVPWLIWNVQNFLTMWRGQSFLILLGP